ncbi:MAG TPA: hypothetical protein VGF85_13595 [Opitutaceae bacterium]|jgi:hypothetical protein
MTPEASPESDRGGGLRAALKWVLFNALALALYLGLEIWVLAPRIRSGAFDPIEIFVLWSKRLLPILVACWGLNVLWAIRIARGPDRQRTRHFVWWLVVFLVWCAALAYKGLGILSQIF